MKTKYLVIVSLCQLAFLCAAVLITGGFCRMAEKIIGAQEDAVMHHLYHRALLFKEYGWSLSLLTLAWAIFSALQIYRPATAYSDRTLYMIMLSVSGIIGAAGLYFMGCALTAVMAH